MSNRDGPKASSELAGILVMAKPAGPTSHDLVALVRRLTGVKRVGHGGTLDPFAAGVLPVFIGRATRMVEYHLGDEKAYRALVIFGARSSTDDLDGELTVHDGAAPSRGDVAAVLDAFRGPLEQVPPDHSAVRVAGRHAYELARHGEKPELRPRRVEIRSLELTAWDESDPQSPTAVLEVRCTAGTYIRALARDIGEKLATGAYLGALTRTASGPFRLEDAHTLEVVRDRLAHDRARDLLLPPDAGLEAYPRLSLSADELGTLAKGQAVRHQTPRDAASAPGGLLRIVDGSGQLAAMARFEAGRLYPEKVFLTPGS